MATIRKQGKAWQAVVRRKGYRTASKSFPKKALAEAWARQTEEKLFAEKVNGLAGYTTVAEILDRYELEIMPRKRGANAESFRLPILRDGLGHYTLEELTAQRIVTFIDMRLQVVTGSTVRRELNILATAIHSAMHMWGIGLHENPVHRARQILKATKTLTPDNKRDRRPTEDELACILFHLPWEMAYLVAFAVETAMRRGEIVHMKPEDRDGNLLHIPETKTDTPRTIPLSTVARAILDDMGGEFKYAESSISNMFQRACRKCGVTDLRFHDLRHEGVSRLIEAGLSISEVRLISGQSLETLQRYTHLKPEDIVEKLR